MHRSLCLRKTSRYVIPDFRSSRILKLACSPKLAQKDILEVLNYQIHYATPQAYQEELWNSLPSLRKLLNFTNAWDQVKTYVWERLNAAVTGEK